MTQRERPPSDGATLAAPRPPRAAPVPAGPAPGRGSLWEDWFERATPELRSQTLQLAASQGLLFIPQLGSVPAAASRVGRPGEEAAPGKATPRPEPTLAAWLHESRPAVLPGAVVPLDAELDADQIRAVARAVDTPDLALIQGFPGTGKSRVVAEIVRQAVRRGRRVLVVAPDGQALDHLTDALARDEGLLFVRCLGPSETPDDPGSAARGATPAEIVRGFSDRLLPPARAAAVAAREAGNARGADEPRWRRFEELLRALTRSDEESAELDRVHADWPARVEADFDRVPSCPPATPLQERWAECLKRRDEQRAACDSRLAALEVEAEKLQSERRELEAEYQQLEPLARAKEGQRWWTGAWWTATLQGAKCQRAQELQQRLAVVAAGQERLAAEEKAARAEREALDVSCAEERRRLAEAECQSRRADLEPRRETVRVERERLDREWSALQAALSPGTAAPAERTPEALRQAREQWAVLREQEDDRARSAEERADGLERAIHSLPGRLVRWAGVVAAPPAALAEPPLAGDAGPALFDLLVVEDAHRMADAELAAAARLAPRRVLVGEPGGDPAPGGGAPPRTNGRRETGRATPPRPALFHKLWRRLHADPSTLPARWFERDGSLVFRLHRVASGQEGYLETEHVADREEIELCILTVPGAEPRLAEVVFAPTVSLPAAREFVYQELQELPVQPVGRSLVWVEGPDRITLEFSRTPETGESAVLEPGLREVVATRPPGVPGCVGGVGVTAALEFARDADWDRERAEHWVAERLHLRDSGRTTFLTRPYRPTGPLARCLGEVLYPGGHWGHLPEWEPSARVATWDESPVEFVPVTRLDAGGPRGTESATRLATREADAGWGAEAGTPETAGTHAGGRTATAPRVRPAGVRPGVGAGLEIDLADPKRAGALPDDLRAALPAHGIVNYAEALAIVGALEVLVHDPALSAARTRGSRGAVPVAVMALYPAQVALLRLLTRGSAVLADNGGRFEIDLPGRFLHRECLVGLLGLTRSHVLRAVPFTAHPDDLVQALTRAVARVVVFGDPGTLQRRAQWPGALDHLDEGAARREQAILNQLLGHWTDPASEATPAAKTRLTESHV